MGVDNHLRDAMENRREFLQHQTDLRRRCASDVPGRDVLRDPDESERLQCADGYGGLSESAADTGRWGTGDIMQHGITPATLKYNHNMKICNIRAIYGWKEPIKKII